MKNAFRLASLFLILVSEACTKAPEILQVLVQCEPVGAALYGGSKFLGYCDQNRIALYPDGKPERSNDIEPITARWASGAEVTSRISLEDGYTQKLRLIRPPDFPNASVDFDFALQYQIAKLAGQITPPSYAIPGTGIYPGVGVVRPDTYVPGYTRSDGTYVQGHYRTLPDASRSNNYSSEGNVNPYTGRRGSTRW
jgi:hypothetical protein